MGKYKIVIDTNVFINGWFNGEIASKEIMDMIDNREFYLAFSQETIGELIYITKNFARKYIDDRQEQLSLVKKIAELYYYASSVNTINTKVDETLISDKNDIMFFKCAVEANADFLVTNDRKSGLLNINEKEYNFKVLTPEDFVSIIKEDLKA